MAPTQEKRMHQAKNKKNKKKPGHREINNNFGRRKWVHKGLKKQKRIKMFSRNWKMQEVLVAEFNQEPKERVQKKRI